MFILTGYLYFSVWFHICLTERKFDPYCPEAAHWDRLGELVPSWQLCGFNYLSVESSESKKDKTLHYANLGEYPSLVVIRTEFSLDGKAGSKIEEIKHCNGVIITQNHVLTTANCLQENPFKQNSLNKRVITILFGEYKLDISKDCVSNDYNTTCAPTPFAIRGEKVMMHEEFNPFSLHHDIAIIELEQSIRDFTDFVQPICLPRGCDELNRSFVKLEDTLTHVGWKIYWPNKGTTPPPSVLQKVDRKSIQSSPGNGCEETYIWYDNNTQLCTVLTPFEEENIHCDEWQGGAYFLDTPSYQITLLGISSYGESCKLGRKFTFGDPTVMTWIPAYTRWILKTLYRLNYAGEPYPYTFPDFYWSI